MGEAGGPGGEDAADGALGRRLLELSPSIVFVVDGSGTITFVDGNLFGLTGFRPHEVVGTHMLDYVDVDWSPMALESVGYAFTSEGLQRPMVFRLKRKDGSTYIAEVTANAQLGDPVVNGLAVYARRWDERHLLDRIIESTASSDSLRTTLKLIVEVMGAETLDADGVVFLEPVEGRFTQSIAVVGMPAALVTDEWNARAPWRHVFEVLEPAWLSVDDLPRRLQVAAGRRGYRSCWALPVPRAAATGAGSAGPDGCLVLWRYDDEEPDYTCRLLLESLVRITALVLQRERAAAALRHAAHHDTLTDLTSRRRFFEELQNALDADDQRRLVGTLYIDLDHFKPVNDKYGHGAGDEVLREVARRLRVEVRDTDVVARLGGDEFAILCLDTEGSHALLALAERITATVRRPISIGDDHVQVGASVGVAVATPGACSIDVLLDAADAALYRVKHTERGGWHLADPIPADQH